MSVLTPGVGVSSFSFREGRIHKGRAKRAANGRYLSPGGSKRSSDVGSAGSGLGGRGSAEAQGVLGHAWDGAVGGEPRIAQVFTSTLAAGGYGGGEAFGGPVETICRQLLRAAYLGTLPAALDLGKSRVVLTMIGGGVFGNPYQLICESVLWAVEEVERLGSGSLEVVLNSRDLASSVDRSWLKQECERRGGILRSLA